MRTFFLLAVLGMAPCLSQTANASPGADVGTPSVAATTGLCEKITCKKSALVEIHTKDAQHFKATLLGLDLAGVNYEVQEDAKEKPRPGRIAWPLFSVSEAEKVLKAGCDAAQAAEWVFAGRVLSNLPGGAKVGATWYAKAEKKDATAKAQVEAAKAAKDLFPPVLVPGQGAQLPRGANPKAWAPESAGSMRAAVIQAKNETEQALVSAKLRLKRAENNLFVLYSDLSPDDTKKWARRFNDIYQGMAGAFLGKESNRNIWHGKAVVLLFKSQQEYAIYHQARRKHDIGGSCGFCVSSSDGLVEISMYQDEQNKDLEYTLYHEFSHGFMHRYQGTPFVQSWINEGLAEYMAQRFTGANHSEGWRSQSAIQALKTAGSLEDFFAAGNIQFKHYGVAGDMTRMMIECDPQRYGLFLGWLKRGDKAEEALRKSYSISLEELVGAYARRIGVKNLKSH